MKQRDSSKNQLALTIALICLASGQAWANTQERPRAENYSNYSQYIQALVDYQRAQETAPTPSATKSDADSKFCSDSQESCEGKYLLVESEEPAPIVAENSSSQAEPTAPPYESVDEVIARAGYSSALESPETNSLGRSTFSEFPLSEIPSQDLSDSGVEGALGLFENVRLKPLTSGKGSASASEGGATISNNDGTVRAIIDDHVVYLDQTDFPLLGGTVALRGGYTVFSSTVTASDDEVDISLQSETRTSLYVVDRDGFLGRRYSNPGAVTVDRLGIIIPQLEINLRSTRNGSGNELFEINVFSPQPIYVDLSGTRIGAAGAHDEDEDGYYALVGESADFLAFGRESLLTIGAGTRVNAAIGRPNGTRSAFVTLNGRVGDINIADISLLTDANGNGIHIGNFGIRNIALVNSRIFLDRQKVVLDVGSGLSNMEMDIERLRLGSDELSPVVGDFYATGGNLQELRVTASPH